LKIPPKKTEEHCSACKNQTLYHPSTQSTLSTTEIEKLYLYNICKGNDSVFLHTLSNSSDESDDESEELIPLTM
jgi:hypothetical protein